MERAKAVFLDRDGVLNRALVRGGKPYPPASVAELEILPGVAEALAALKRGGFTALVVSNQPDVARGTQRREVVEEIDRYLADRLPLDDFLICYHDDCDGCACRKPRPGLLLQAARQRNINPAASYMVGDRWRDIEAGRRAGCKTVFIDYGYAEPGPSTPPDAKFGSLLDASRWILHQEVSENRT